MEQERKFDDAQRQLKKVFREVEEDLERRRREALRRELVEELAKVREKENS